MMLDRDTQVSFERQQNEIVAVLIQGRIVFTRPQEGTKLRLRADDVSIVPSLGAGARVGVYKTAAALVIATRRGSVHVEGVEQGADLREGQAGQFTAAGIFSVDWPAPVPARGAPGSSLPQCSQNQAVGRPDVWTPCGSDNQCRIRIAGGKVFSTLTYSA